MSHHPNLSENHPEELSLLFATALKRLERQRAATVPHSETTTTTAFEEESTLVVEEAEAAPRPSSANSDSLAEVSTLFDELLAALRCAIESGQGLDYGQFVLDELERIRGDLDVCRLLVCDAHLSSATPA